LGIGVANRYYTTFSGETLFTNPHIATTDCYAMPAKPPGKGVATKVSSAICNIINAIRSGGSSRFRDGQPMARGHR
ncbi:MAG: hypothetical protein ACYCXJ_06935, partial [Thermoleophilia bacterium]